MTAPAAPAPTEGPATTTGVLVWLGITDPTDEIRATVHGVVAGVNAVVARWLPRPADGWPPDHVQGAVMLAGRVYRRKDSPAGVVPFGADAGAVYVSRNDPDVAMLLGLGAYAAPQVG